MLRRFELLEQSAFSSGLRKAKHPLLGKQNTYGRIIAAHLLIFLASNEPNVWYMNLCYVRLDWPFDWHERPPQCRLGDLLIRYCNSVLKCSIVLVDLIREANNCKRCYETHCCIINARMR